MTTGNYNSIGSGGSGGSSNGQYRGTVTQTSSSTVIGTSAGYVGTGGTVSNSAPIISWASIGPARCSIEDAGIRAGEIKAYRAWYLRDNVLHSVFVAYRWDHRQKIHNSDVDTEYVFGKGFHAFRNLDQAYLDYPLCPRLEGEAVVYGEVKLWGTVVEHERGYRAEYIKITRFLDIFHPKYGPDGNRNVLKALCVLYNVSGPDDWRSVPKMEENLALQRWSYFPSVDPKSIRPSQIVVDSKSWTGRS